MSSGNFTLRTIVRCRAAPPPFDFPSLCLTLSWDLYCAEACQTLPLMRLHASQLIRSTLLILAGLCMAPPSPASPATSPRYLFLQQADPPPASPTSPVNPQLLFAKGQAALQSGDLAAAESAFRG